ncbi:MAG: NAD(P)(+) transhydrogenase (Re/Si-specific) subunit beta [Candidatus Methylomirabilia bacterium]
MADLGLTELLYLLAAVLFMLGLKRLSAVKTARTGNLLSMVAMVLAVGVTLLRVTPVNWGIILTAAALGTVIGAVSAMKVRMTAMPQMVALFNGFGGGASALVAVSEFFRGIPSLPLVALVAIVLSALVGGVTLTGSIIAFGKLQEIIPGKPILFTGRHVLNLLLLLTAVGLGLSLILGTQAPGPFVLLAAIALTLGVLLVIPIGGADMPVVISLLNSYSGVAVATTGFVLSNNLLIIVGSLVGAAGLILTRLMCVAMNRSLANVLFGGFGATAETAVVGTARGAVKAGTIEDAVTVMENAGSAIVVPGYGMAVAQAQHAVRDLANLLEDRGATVRYAIHPVAGRMPGHMNVLLAEANVPYDRLYGLDEINDDFAKTDVALVVGANDVVNPAAKTDPKSPIYGMPVLNVDEARTVIVLKRSMNPGFAGIDNELFVRPNTMMVFGDAKQTLTKIAATLKE